MKPAIVDAIREIERCRHPLRHATTQDDLNRDAALFFAQRLLLDMRRNRTRIARLFKEAGEKW